MDLHVFPIPIPPPAALPIFNFHFMGKKIKVEIICSKIPKQLESSSFFSNLVYLLLFSVIMKKIYI